MTIKYKHLKKDQIETTQSNLSLRQHLMDLSGSFATSWRDSVISYCQFTEPVENFFPVIQEIAYNIIEIIGQEDWDSEQAHKIGNKIAELNLLHPEHLAFTQKIFLANLSDYFSKEELLIIYPRYCRLMVEVIAGYIVSVQDNILIEQEQIRSSIEKARDEAETAKQQIEIRNNLIVETIPEIIIIINNIGDIIYYHSGKSNPNRQNVNLVGVNIQNIIPKDLFDRFNTLCKKAHETGEMQTLVTSYPVKNKIKYFEGRVVSYEEDKSLTVVRDITDILESENALKISQARLQEMTRQLITAQEYERHQIALELHDQVLSQLGALLIFMDETSIPKEYLDNYHKLIEQIRNTIYGLRPPMLNYGLFPALEDLIYYVNNHVPTNSSVLLNVSPDDIRFDPNIELHLFRIIQEATTNALKHSHADQIIISGNIEADEIQLAIDDNGVGIPDGDTIDLTQALVNNHFGLAGMFERAALIDAEISVLSKPEQGTKVTIHWKAKQ